MPLINVRTSLKNVENSEEILKELSDLLANLTGKPDSYVMAILDTDVPMTFAGNIDPCCYIEIKSIGALDPSKMAKEFCSLVSSKTGIPGSRIYIGFEDIPAQLWGWNGRTFG